MTPSSSLFSDHAARLAAQTVFDRPLLLEAGAGTGKTTTLVARTLCWCIGPGWDEAAARLEDAPDHKIAAEALQGVVAITFTEAAAAEMAARIAEALASVVDGRETGIRGLEATALRPSDSATRRHRAAALLETFDHLTVSTIHAFCFALLTDHPLQANVHPDLRVDADGREIEAVARLAVERHLQDAYRSGTDSPFLALASRALGPAQLMDAIVQWLSIGAPLDLLEVDPLEPGRVQTFVAELTSVSHRLHVVLGGRLNDLADNRRGKGIALALDASLPILRAANGPNGDLAALTDRVREIWTADDLGRLRQWHRRELNREEERRLGEVQDELSTAAGDLHTLLRHARRLDPVLLDAARGALLPVLRQIDQDLRARGVITFAGLLRESRALLASAPGVARRLRQRIRLLLVDEFQDTDPIQSEIVRRLALEGDPAECPSLFVVGDPKQSIYGWRDADLASYEAFESLIRERGGEKHELRVNFRSTQEILDEVERAIEPVMLQEPGLQPPFRPLEAAGGGPLPFRRDRWSEIEYWVSWRPDDTGEPGPGSQPESVMVEARAVAEDVRRLHDSAGVAWNEIAVLFRKTQAMPRFLEEMRRLDIPFAVNRDRSYYQRREIIDAAAWVRAILSPADHLALLTVLRSVTVGVPDAALIPLWTRSFPEFVTELRRPDSERLAAVTEVVSAAAAAVSREVPGLDRVSGWEQNLIAALHSLAHLRESFRTDPPDRFVSNLRRRLLIEASESARFQGKFRLANLQRFFSQLEAAMEADDADVHSILRALRIGVRQSREAEEAAPRDAVEEAVQVMTIHTAKGLEFGHVYLVQMHAGTGTGTAIAIDAREVTTDDWEYQLFRAPTLGYHRAEAKTRQIECAEAVRTLYVAMTRASERLVLVGSWPTHPSPVAPGNARNYLDLLQNRNGLPSDLLALISAAESPDNQGARDPSGVQWRILGAASTTIRSQVDESAADWLPDGRELEAIRRRRASRLETAAARMARPLQAAVTHSDRQDRVPFDTPGTGDQAQISRSEALRIGTAVHRCLELWDLEAPLPEELQRQIASLPHRFPEPPSASTLRMATEELERLADSALISRLLALRDQVVGREVPVLLPPDPKDDLGPTGCLAGSIDLLCRDSHSDEFVVIDFKTDRVPTEEDLDRRASGYVRQLARYARAVQEAFGLARRPRGELWFLDADAVRTYSGEELL